MAKRILKTKHKKKARDFYATPIEAVWPLLPHLPSKIRFVEPNGGKASLILNLETYGHKCVEAYDIKPQKHKWQGVIKQQDILDGKWKPKRKHDYIIGNPPFSAHLLLPMIRLFIQHSPTWLLLPFDFLATVQGSEFEYNLVSVVVIGRIKWFSRSRYASVDNFCWYYFEPKARKGRQPKVYMRKPKDEIQSNVEVANGNKRSRSRITHSSRKRKHSTQLLSKITRNLNRDETNRRTK